MEEKPTVRFNVSRYFDDCLEYKIIIFATEEEARKEADMLNKRNTKPLTSYLVSKEL